jgi:Tfp pilus assembly protein PilX
MRAEPCRSGERGAALIVAILVTALLMLLAMTLLTLSDTEMGVAANDTWSEGAFFAAEAAAQRALDQIGPNRTTSMQAVPLTTLGDGYSFRSGRRTDATAQPLQYLGTAGASGFTLGTGTGYNQAGFRFEVYQVNTTGLGPRNAAREVELQVEYGPTPN